MYIYIYIYAYGCFSCFVPVAIANALLLLCGFVGTLNPLGQPLDPVH